MVAAPPGPALVTGAASGIGRAAALAFAASRAHVVLADISDAEPVARAIRERGGEATFIQTDVSKEADVVALVAAAVDLYGPLGAAFNNAGIAGPVGPFEDVSLRAWQRVIDTDLTSVFLCMREQVRVMRSHGVQGAIVNTASMAALRPPPGAPLYVAAKTGVVGLTQAVAAEVARDGIRVNAICPGGTDTPMMRRMASADPAVADRWTHRPLASPSQVAAAAVWLCSGEASFISGAAVPIDAAAQFG